jgi:hypothetical protein
MLARSEPAPTGGAQRFFEGSRHIPEMNVVALQRIAALAQCGEALRERPLDERSFGCGAERLSLPVPSRSLQARCPLE